MHIYIGTHAHNTYVCTHTHKHMHKLTTINTQVQTYKVSQYIYSVP